MATPCRANSPTGKTNLHSSTKSYLPLDHPAQAARSQRLLDPNDFDDTATLARALNDFECRYNEIAKPFDWTFMRQDLAELFERLEDRQEKPRLSLVA